MFLKPFDSNVPFRCPTHVLLSWSVFQSVGCLKYGLEDPSLDMDYVLSN